MKTNLITHWKKLEDSIQDHAKERMAHYGVFLHRFYDTRTAGTLMPQQPADFLVLPQTGRTIFLEAKFSEAHDSLCQCFSDAVKSHQLASARLVTRAKADYRVLFYSGLSGLVELWDGLYLAEQRAQGKRLKLMLRLHHGFSLTEALDAHVLRLIKYQQPVLK
jgi:hypothetical protein